MSDLGTPRGRATSLCVSRLICTTCDEPGRPGSPMTRVVLRVRSAAARATDRLPAVWDKFTEPLARDLPKVKSGHHWRGDSCSISSWIAESVETARSRS